MDAREMAENYRLAHWSRLIHERCERRLSVKDFCEEAGFNPNMYYYWQRKLRQAAIAQISDVRPAIPKPDSATPCFAEVRLTPTEVRPDNVTPTGRLCVEFAGMQISADSSYPPEKLAILLRELVRPC